MSDFSFLAVPNIEGMRLGWYIQLFGIVIVFGVSLFFVLYGVLRQHKKRHVANQLDHNYHQSQDLAKQLLIQKIHQSSGKDKLVLFIEYVEKFVTTKAYANPGELLSDCGFTHHEIEACERTLYVDASLENHIAMKIDKSSV